MSFYFYRHFFCHFKAGFSVLNSPYLNGVARINWERSDHRLRFFAVFQLFHRHFVAFHSHFDRRETYNFWIYIYISERNCTWPKEKPKKKEKQSPIFYDNLFYFRYFLWCVLLKWGYFFLFSLQVCTIDVYPFTVRQTHSTICSHAWATSFEWNINFCCCILIK